LGGEYSTPVKLKDLEKKKKLDIKKKAGKDKSVHKESEKKTFRTYSGGASRPEGVDGGKLKCDKSFHVREKHGRLGYLGESLSERNEIHQQRTKNV